MQGDLSYSAWSGGVTNYSAVPVRLDVAPEERSSAEEGCVSASAWNQAGTFETRDLSNWAQARGAVEQPAKHCAERRGESVGHARPLSRRLFDPCRRT